MEEENWLNNPNYINRKTGEDTDRQDYRLKKSHGNRWTSCLTIKFELIKSKYKTKSIQNQIQSCAIRNYDICNVKLIFVADDNDTVAFSKNYLIIAIKFYVLNKGKKTDYNKCILRIIFHFYRKLI